MAEIVYRAVPAGDVACFSRNETLAFQQNRVGIRLQPGMHDQLRGLYVDGALVAQLRLYPYQIMTGSGTLACGGIGNLATPVEYRRRGYSAELLRCACLELRERGTMLALVFPAQRAFFQRFGWATAIERKVYYGAPGRYAHVRRSADGAFTEVGTEAVAALQQVYSGALRGRFGPLIRDEEHWTRQLLQDGNGTPRQAYLWRGAGGSPRAYLIASFEQPQPGRNLLRIREAVALDPLARSQIFVLLADFASQCAEVVLPTPADAPVSVLLPEPPRCEVEPTAMLRLTDVAGALAAFRYPQDVSGRVTVEVADDWLDQNQGLFELTVEAGQGSCRRIATGEGDLRCNVGTLAQIYSRYLRPRTAAAFGLLEMLNRPALSLLDKLFTGLAPFCSDYF